MNVRNDILAIYKAAIDAVEGQQVVAEALPRILKQQALEEEPDSVQLVSIGKAAEAMLKGALEVLGGKVSSSLLISKYEHTSEEIRSDQNIQAIESAHPVPDENSLKAGDELTNFLQLSDAPCIFLLSGGASSLVEVLDTNWELDDLQKLTQWMLANGYSIDEMNAIRRRVSCIKGGGLWNYLRERKVICLMISDVPDDNVNVIGSGLLFPISENERVPDSLPQQWKARIPDAKKIDIPGSFFFEIVANNTLAVKVAAEKARSLGYRVKTGQDFLEENAEDIAKQCINVATQDPGTLFIWGAETTVILPEKPGRGGRNQHLALAAAIDMKGQENTYLLSAGTDGTDGMTDDAGAIVDGETIHRGQIDGLDARHCLQQADSGTFLHASGDLVSTGVTGTNVMDLIIAWSEGSA